MRTDEANDLQRNCWSPSKAPQKHMSTMLSNVLLCVSFASSAVVGIVIRWFRQTKLNQKIALCLSTKFGKLFPNIFSTSNTILRLRHRPAHSHSHTHSNVRCKFLLVFLVIPFKCIINWMTTMTHVRDSKSPYTQAIVSRRKCVFVGRTDGMGDGGMSEKHRYTQWQYTIDLSWE